MATYKYEATLSTGITVFGVHEVANRDELIDYLKRRNLTLVSEQELTLSTQLTTDTKELPRMFQLRIGERLREAILSGLPTHQAVRAIANEPIEHPLLMVMPWLMILLCFCSVVLIGLAGMVEEVRSYALCLAVSLPVIGMIGWLIVSTILVSRPRRALFRIADQLERGQIPNLKTFELMSGDLGAVARSSLDERAKATSLADLVPSTTATNLRSHQMAVGILGPLIVSGVLFLGVHFFCLTVVPMFREIFQGFGISLPMITAFTLEVSSFFELFGITGWLFSVAVLGSILGLMYMFLVSSRWTELISRIPWLGLSARWLLQARMARMLSILLRNNADPALAVEVAADGSRSELIRREGQKLASLIREGSAEFAYSQLLSGLPLSMLFQVSESSQPDSKRQQASQSFSLYADALERAASGNGVIFGLIVEMFVVTFSATLVGFVVISFFMPLIQLLNDLAVCFRFMEAFV